LGLIYHQESYTETLMLLDVTFFALYRERAGCNRCQLEVSDGGTVADLTDAVRLRFPNLAPPDVKIVVAVNTEYADPEQALHPGDDVCLIPPVSGGSRHD
jgi:molybdopterin converting factor subunit 1